MPSTQYMSYGNSKARGRGGRRPKEEEEHLNPEDIEKRKLRRQRNKEAAARCRQRRLDHMTELQKQVDGLEEEMRAKEDEIERLKHEKAELEYALRTHDCKMSGLGNGFVPAPSKAFFKKVNGGFQPTKVEPTLNQVVNEGDTKLDLMLPPQTTITPTTLEDSLLISRPSTLSLGMSLTPTTPGVQIQTPSNGLNFADLLGMPTGLTPVNSNTLTPFLSVTSSSILETPTTTMDTSDGMVLRASLHQL